MGCECCKRTGGGSTHALAFDACPHCGFAYGTGAAGGDGAPGVYGQVRVWKSIFGRYRVRSRAELIRKLDLSREPGGPRDPDGVWPSVFDYEGAGRTS